MSRKAYISDHLLDMRDHLKRNYEKLHQESSGSPAPVTDGIPQESAKTSPGEAVTGERKNVEQSARMRYMPSIRKNNVPERKNDRERRELEGRVIHDLAWTECELELMDKKLEELRRFNAVLKQEHARLMEIAESSETVDLAPLQAEYFAAGGRWKAFAQDSTPNNIEVPFPQNSVYKAGYWWVVAAILLSAGIISVALLNIF